ncbi:hypothetical protein PVK06_036258 [Gossypium arboreum]|uniref:MATH domain-containing protein n=1 Tax=Gossypium arboreum TaxID=29729 RepID=A0ABR0NLA2_GOSAR|nr:hypothetical protein PVK06_036258 [Gossypium arboreum]
MPMDVNGLTTKATWKIEVLSGVNGQVTKVTWRIENFSSINVYKLCSENFTVDGNKWPLNLKSLSSAEEDVNTFFTGLESELSSSRIVYSKEEAKKAMAKINEALNMTPVNLNDSGKFSPLKQAFMILASFDYSSTTLTIEQKNELLGLEERLKELANRAAKVVQDKDQLTAKESIKWTMTCNLESSLIRYKEVETEVKQVDQILAALHVQVEKAQKKRKNMLGKRNEIFKSCKEMKMELEALEKQWAEYEVKAKVGEEEEEKRVEAEWGRIKNFISDLKTVEENL